MRGRPYRNTSSTAVIDTAAPNATTQPTPAEPADCSAKASGSAEWASSVYGTMPVSTNPTTTQITVQIASPPRMPIGRLRCGSRVSSAAVEIASKPM